MPDVPGFQRGRVICGNQYPCDLGMASIPPERIFSIGKMSNQRLTIGWGSKSQNNHKTNEALATMIVMQTATTFMKDLRSLKGRSHNKNGTLHDSCGSEEFRVNSMFLSSSFRTKRKHMVSCDPSQEFASGTATTTSSSTTPIKAVRFQVNASSGAIAPEVYTFPRYSPAEVRDVCWSPTTRTEFLNFARYDCDDITLDEADLLEQLDETYLNSTATVDLSSSNRETELAIHWAQTTGRGLESAVMESLRKSRRKHVKGVLKCQEKYRNSYGSSETMVRLLRKQSMKSSTKAATFACLLAVGDQHVGRDQEPSKELKC